MALERDIVKFTDNAVSDLTSGAGKLNPDKSNQFIQKIFERPGLISDVRTVQMNADSLILPKIGLGSRIVRVAPGGTAPYVTDGVAETFANNRNLASANRYAPTFESVTINAYEYMAEVHITDDIIENNIEKEGFMDTLMNMSLKRIGSDLEDLLINSDTSNGALAAELKVQNGLFKGVTSNVYSTSTATGSAAFYAMHQMLPVKYLGDLANMKYYVNPRTENKYRYSLIARNTSLGDSALQGKQPVAAMGNDLATTPFLAEASSVFMNPKNVILGFQRNIRLETERLPRSRMTAFIFTFKAGFGIEQEDAIVKATTLT